MSAADNIARTLLDLSQITGEGARAAAAIRAQAQATTGQLWGNTLANLGQFLDKVSRGLNKVL